MKKNSAITQELADTALQSALEWAKSNPKNDSEDTFNGASEELRQKLESDFNKYAFTKYEFNPDTASLNDRYRVIGLCIEEAIVLFVKACSELAEEERLKLHKALIEITESYQKWISRQF